MRTNDDNPDVARHLERIEIRQLERPARELRLAQREVRGDNGAFVAATIERAPLRTWLISFPNSRSSPTSSRGTQDHGAS